MKSGSEEWKASVSLHIVETGYDSKLKERKRPIAFYTTSNPNQLDLIIRQAQKAVLNPKEILAGNWKQFLDHKFVNNPNIEQSDIEAESNELKFTCNTVIITIQQRDVDLTLVDLPGIIQASHSSDESFIAGIKNMVVSYIESKNVIIVAVISCQIDPENQPILQLVRTYDPRGERTVGLLTKPDRIEEGTDSMWRLIMSNKRYALAHGYYMMKAAAAHERTSSTKNTLDIERAYFSKQQSWLASYPGRIGSWALRDDLSKRMISIVKNQVPKIAEQLRKELFTVRDEISGMPLAPNPVPMVEFVSITGQISEIIRKILSCQDSDHLMLWHALESESANLHQQLINELPHFVTDERKNELIGSKELDSNDSKYDVTHSGNDKAKNIAEATKVNSFDSPYPNVYVIDENDVKIMIRPKNIFGFEELRDEMSSLRGYSLPDDLPTSISSKYLNMPLKILPTVLSEFAENVSLALQEAYCDKVKTICMRFPRLSSRIISVLLALQREQLAACQTCLKCVSDAELAFPLYTVKKERYRILRDKILNNTMESLKIYDPPQVLTDLEDQDLKDALKLAARVKARSMLMIESIYDSSSRLVASMIIKQFEKQSIKRLYVDIAAKADDTELAHIMREDEDIAQKREVATDRFNRLKEAQRAFNVFERTS